MVVVVVVVQSGLFRIEYFSQKINTFMPSMLRGIYESIVLLVRNSDIRHT